MSNTDNLADLSSIAVNMFDLSNYELHLLFSLDAPERRNALTKPRNYGVEFKADGNVVYLHTDRLNKSNVQDAFRM